MSSDPFVNFKAAQREGWALFAPFEDKTTQPAGQLVHFAGISKGARVLDVGCGTGVTSITAAFQGAEVQGLDLSPALLERARYNASIAQLEIQFQEGDIEHLPYKDSEFDYVISQFGHMFAPRPDVAISEMLRVLKSGGKIAFSTWPPELYTGQMFALVGRYLPPPEGVPSPALWGDPTIIKDRLGDKVKDILFDRSILYAPSLSIDHMMLAFETTSAPLIKLKEKLQNEDPKAYESFRNEFRHLISKYRRLNTLYQHFLMTKAVKR